MNAYPTATFKKTQFLEQSTVVWDVKPYSMVEITVIFGIKAFLV